MIDKKLKEKLLSLSGIAIAQNMTLEELLGKDGTIITAKIHGDKADLKAMPLSEIKDTLNEIQEMLEGLDSNHCQFCGNKLTLRVEKGYVNEYDFEKGSEEVDHESLRTDTEIDIHEYKYCDYCDTHFHNDLVLDGRNDLTINKELFNQKFVKSEFKDRMDFLFEFTLIHMKLENVVKLNATIKNEAYQVE